MAANPPSPSAQRRARQAKQFLDEQQLPQILEDFVVDCAEKRPKDVIAFMAQWAAQRSNKELLAKETSSANFEAVASGAFTSPKRTVTLAVVGLEDRDEVLETLSSDAEEWSEGLKKHVAHTRSHLKLINIQSPTVVALESSTHTFVVVDIGDIVLTRELQALLHTVDGIVGVFSCRSAIQDLSKRREGHFYNQLLAANALGVKRAIALITNFGSAGDSVVSQLLAECRAAFTSSGFAAASVPMIKFRAKEELSSIGDQVPFIARKPPPAAETVTHLKATVMALSADGLSVGESLAGFLRDSFGCRIDVVNATIDKETNQVVAVKPFMLKKGEVGVLTLLLSGGCCLAAVGAQILLTKGDRVAAFGTVTKLGSGEDDDEVSVADTSTTEDFQLGDSDDQETDVDEEEESSSTGEEEAEEEGEAGGDSDDATVSSFSEG